GYSSLSHFICEFKRHYGETPRNYAERLREGATFSISESQGA
ncbi:MAG: Helix-turn-helix domain, partial [Ilumatobacteraceae bacterium]